MPATTDTSGFSARQLDALMAVNAFVSVLSMLGTLFIMVSFVVIPAMRGKFAFRLVFFLAMSDFMFSLANLLGRPGDGTARCYVQAVFISYFTLASVLWTTCIAYVLKVAITHVHRQALGVHRKARVFHGYSWGIPLALTLLPLISSSYGEAGGAFCWIRAEPPGEFFRFAQFYMPLWCAMFYNLKVYVQARETINRAVSSGVLPEDHSRRGNSLLLYPLILVICWTFGTVNRIQNIAQPDKPVFALYFLQIFFSASQGLLHALAYLMTPSVRAAVSHWLWPRQYASPRSSPETKDDDLEEEDVPHEAGVELVETRDSDDGAARGGGGDDDVEDDEREVVALVGDDGLDSSGGGGGGGRERRGSLVDVSYQVRGAYLQGLGVYELMGLHIEDTAEGYKQLYEMTGGAPPDHQEVMDGVAAGKKKKTGTVGTYLNLFKGFLGIGILALPAGFSYAGYILATLVMVIVAYLAHHCMVILLKVKAKLAHEGSEIQLTFSGIGYHSFGDRGRQVVDLTLIGVQIGAGIAYLIFIGKNLDVVFTSSPLTRTEYVLIATVAMLPFVFMRTLKHLVPAALLADAVMLFGLSSIFGYDFRKMAADAPHVNAFTVAKFPLFFGTAVFAFEGIGLVLPIHGSMQRPEKFESMLKKAMVCLTTLYISFGAIGYVSWGDETQDLVTLNLPKNNFVRFVQVCYCIGLFFTSPIIMFPAFQIIEDYSWYRALPECNGVKMYAVRFFIMAFCFTCAVTIPHFGLFINLIGAAAGTMIAFILPSLFYLKHFWVVLSARERALEYFVVVFGTVGGLVAVALTMQEFIQLGGGGGGE